VTVVRYLLDEHIDHAIREGLHRRRPELEIHAVGDSSAPNRGTPDPDILIWCETARFVLVTNNRATMPVHLRAHLAAGRHIPGILMLNPGMSIGEVIDELELVWDASDAEEYADRISYLPVTG
jgi:Domain of unknown function (DUF5615)